MTSRHHLLKPINLAYRSKLPQKLACSRWLPHRPFTPSTSNGISSRQKQLLTRRDRVRMPSHSPGSPSDFYPWKSFECRFDGTALHKTQRDVGGREFLPSPTCRMPCLASALFCSNPWNGYLTDCDIMPRSRCICVRSFQPL